jgi:protein ImuB
MVVVAKSGSKRFLSAVDAAAARLGLRVGTPASKAQALVPGLSMHDADPSGDAEALHRMALWALRQFTPVVAVDGDDGLVMDTEGADHLQGGERLMLSGIVNRLHHVGVEARAAVADTWGAAHALARFSTGEPVVVPRGETARAVVRLPVAALRFDGVTLGSLSKLGVETVGELSAMPRATLALRFGPQVGHRIDQMFGRKAEPIVPVRSPEIVEVHRAFAEPIGAAETIAKYVGRLVTRLCAELERRGLGVKRADLVAHRVDNTVQALRVGTAKPVLDVKRLTRLICDRIDKIDPGFGIEKMSLVAVMAEEIEARQTVSTLAGETAPDVSGLVDLLANRGQKLYRLAPVASDVPERSVRRVSPLAEETGADWRLDWQRPARLLKTPEEIAVMALVPDHPPAMFTWRGKRRRVKRADGPERVFGEWWKRDSELDAARDYYTVEDEAGERYWVYRAGDGTDTAGGSQKWFMHGIFG